jgi:hypothetical protein
VLAISLKDAVNDAAAKTFKLTDGLGVGVPLEVDEPPQAERSRHTTIENRKRCSRRFMRASLRSERMTRVNIFE